MTIKLVAMDVDGTLTDGGIYMSADSEYKKFHVRDGWGIVELMKRGIEAAFISGRHSPATEARAANLGVRRVFNGADNKIEVLLSLAAEIGVSRDEVAFIGDDVPDVPCIEWAGLGIAVGDAAYEAKAAANFVTSSFGGHGAVREAIRYLFRLNGDTSAS
jgi:3-deoxy-D-manno-octulosonate 8-phosphate phosphatase (KDO 8-P phosphatase)